jgi:hypothetical protein
MLNTYRIISLSLVTALFFAAPLLCIQPISFQIKKAQNSQHKRVRVVSHRATHTPQITSRNVSAAWARSIHTAGHKTIRVNAPVSTLTGDESFDEDYRGDWEADEEDGGIGAGTGTTSYSDL